jgi:hypothetical protein
MALAPNRPFSRAVELNKNIIDFFLLGGILSDQGSRNLTPNVTHGLQYSFPEIALGFIVPQFFRFPFASGSASGGSRTSHQSITQNHVSLDGREASGIEDFPRSDCFNLCCHHDSFQTQRAPDIHDTAFARPSVFLSSDKS